MTGWMWILVTVIGVALLGLALAYGTHQTNVFRRNPRNVRRTEEATRRLQRENEQADGS